MSNRPIRRLAAAVLFAGLIVSAYAGVATAATAHDSQRERDGVAAVSTEKSQVGATAYETYKNEATGECIDADKFFFRVYECNGTTWQKWAVKHWNDGTVRFMNLGTGQCLTDSDDSLGMAGYCTKSEYQSFIVKHWNDGTMRFQNEATGQCVEANSTDIWSSTSCDSSESQSWY